jgi:hypothetical protein
VLPSRCLSKARCIVERIRFQQIIKTRHSSLQTSSKSADLCNLSKIPIPRQHGFMKTWLPLFMLSFAAQCFASNIAITTPTLPNGTVDTTYSEVIKASGGCTPYKWAIASGALPTGVIAKASSTTTALDLSGKPAKAATYSFAVKAMGCGGASSQVSYKLVIQSTAEHVVDLRWKASTSSDVSGYNIYRGAAATTMKRVNASPIASTAYTDSSVANGSTYYYATTAVDTEGRESSQTTPVKAVIP